MEIISARMKREVIRKIRAVSCSLLALSEQFVGLSLKV
jgi:hypothetical protein